MEIKVGTYSIKGRVSRSGRVYFVVYLPGRIVPVVPGSDLMGLPFHIARTRIVNIALKSVVCV